MVGDSVSFCFSIHFDRRTTTTKYKGGMDHGSVSCCVIMLLCLVTRGALRVHRKGGGHRKRKKTGLIIRSFHAFLKPFVILLFSRYPCPSFLFLFFLKEWLTSPHAMWVSLTCHMIGPHHHHHPLREGSEFRNDGHIKPPSPPTWTGRPSVRGSVPHIRPLHYPPTPVFLRAICRLISSASSLKDTWGCKRGPADALTSWLIHS